MTAAHGDLLEELRPPTFAVAYRMLGSVAEAEDVVQEVLLRLHTALEGGEHIASPRAYAATIATRLSIDVLRSARVRRETYVGEWLPEPLITAPGDPADDPARQAEMADSLSMAFLLLLERLSPEQRAALLLHDVFDYGYDEVANIVGTSEQNARQLATRARRQVTDGRPRFETSEDQRAELGRRFFQAARDGDFADLEALLAPDVALRGDGGGKVPALARALQGRSRVAKTLAIWLRRVDRLDVTISETEVNGEPGAIMRGPDGNVFAVMVLEISGGEIRAIDSVVNPDKLRHVGPLTDIAELLRQARRAR